MGCRWPQNSNPLEVIELIKAVIEGGSGLMVRARVSEGGFADSESAIGPDCAHIHLVCRPFNRRGNRINCFSERICETSFAALMENRKKRGEAVSRFRADFGSTGGVERRWPAATSQPPGSTEVLPTQEVIDHLATRIEQAYSLRRSGWDRGCSTRRLWAAAALRLWQAHVDDPGIPLDSELFVASQPISGSLGDPWAELTQAEAGRRYRIQVRRIVRRLRRELWREVRRAEALLSDGGRLILSSLTVDRQLSALGCYIAAYRSGRADIAEHFAGAAVEQHRACPLYQMASLALLPADCYPVDARVAPPEASGSLRNFKKSIVLN